MRKARRITQADYHAAGRGLAKGIAADIRSAPRRPKAPRLIPFEFVTGGLLTSKWTWKWVAYRCPNKGEFYMSGALPTGYRARQHLTTEYHIIEPITEHVRRMRWVPKSEADIPEDDE